VQYTIIRHSQGPRTLAYPCKCPELGSHCHTLVNLQKTS